MLPLTNTLWAAALGVAMLGNLWLYLNRTQVQRDLARAQTALAAEQADRQRERADAATALAAATEQARQTEAQWRAQHTEVQTHAQAQIRAASADAARARGAADSLQRRAEVIAAQCANPQRDSAAGSGFTPRGPAAPDPGAVLAELLGRLAQTAGELAAIADARGAAGAACERAYDGVASMAR
jgi:hypothetical protein